MTDESIKIAVLEERLRNLEKNLDAKYNALEAELEKKANRSELQPIRIIVFGFVGTIMLAVIGALLNLVLSNGDSSGGQPPTIQ
tara:strand:- start:495 stop:746 length:252 start_codon:yes stop_codon:yes gene_type:complete